MKSRFDYRLGIPATKDEWSTFMVGLGGMFAMAWAGAACVVLSWAALTSDILRASFLELNLAAGACAFVVGAVLWSKLLGERKEVRGALGRASRALAGGAAAFVSFKAGRVSRRARPLRIGGGGVGAGAVGRASGGPGARTRLERAVGPACCGRSGRGVRCWMGVAARRQARELA